MERPSTRPLPQPARPQNDGCLPIILRLFWLVGGEALLMVFCFKIFQKKVFSVLDAVFWVTVLAMALVRYVDISRFHGQTADSQPAGMGHWRRYVLLLLAASVALWALAHGLPYLLGR